MARKREEETVTQAEVYPIEELFDRYEVPRWARAGLMAHEQWAAGKRLTEAAFETSLNEWLKKPVGR